MLRTNRGVTIWFTGLPCSGKSTLASTLERRLRELRFRVEILDGDVIRPPLSKGLGYTKEDRDTNVRRIEDRLQSPQPQRCSRHRDGGLPVPGGPR